MSNFNGHRNLGIFASIIVLVILFYLRGVLSLSTQVVWECALVTFLFSLFPDLDTKSTPSRVFYFIMICYLGWAYLSGQHKTAHLVAGTAMLPQILTHRGLLHSHVTSIILPGIVFLSGMSLQSSIIMYLAGVFGYNAHLFLDRF